MEVCETLFGVSHGSPLVLRVLPRHCYLDTLSNCPEIGVIVGGGNQRLAVEEGKIYLLPETSGVVKTYICGGVVSPFAHGVTPSAVVQLNCLVGSLPFEGRSRLRPVLARRVPRL